MYNVRISRKTGMYGLELTENAWRGKTLRRKGDNENALKRAGVICAFAQLSSDRVSFEEFQESLKYEKYYV